MIVDPIDKKVICTNYELGKRHDFRIFKESKIHVLGNIEILTDSAYQGILKIHQNSVFPKKRSKNHPLSKEDKKNNRELSRKRVFNEHVIGVLKRFRIISERYRNRRKRFALRFNLIAGIYNYELSNS